jgi:FAD/FMN-containing dehydrogenase
MQTLADDANPDHIYNYWRSASLDELGDDVINLIVEQANRAESPLATTVLGLFGGAMGRVGSSDTAFAHRKAMYYIGMEAKWTDPTEDARHIAWARSFSKRLEPYSSHAYLLNFLDDEGPETVRRAFGENYARLVALKTRYDPTNFFSINQNVAPARQGRAHPGGHVSAASIQRR